MQNKNTVGLTHAKAMHLLATFGRNEIVDRPRQTPVEIFLSQFTSFLVILLIVASIASLFLGDMLDGFFILLIVILNGILGFIQEYKAEKAIALLKKMTTSNVRVIRDGTEQMIDSKLLVPGDVIKIEDGDKIPADCRLLESLHLETNEASLTGESMPVEKNSKDGEKRLVYLGTIVAKGRATAEVVATGMRTRFGQIAASLSEIREEETPLEKKLNVLGKELGVLAIAASITVFLIGIITSHQFLEMILTSISLAVAAVPEGLPAVITITLAIGMQRMAKKRAILRRLSSIEALGSTTVIATDKTGTLTRNEMRVAKVWMGGTSYQSNDNVLTQDDPVFSELTTVGVVCNNASLIFRHDHGGFDVVGDTTEGALLLWAGDKGMVADRVKKHGKLLEEYAFDASLKLMTVVWRAKEGDHIFTKGAPEVVLDKSIAVMGKTKIQALSEAERAKIRESFRAFARQGYRIIALASRKTKGLPKSREDAEKNLVFLGFVGIADPARPEVKDAIAAARIAGIQTIMITGDNELTANAIASKIGLIRQGETVITGAQFEQMSDEQVLAAFDKIRIFARTTPSDKLRIVRLLQRKGHVVAVTGDGVNDAPALKQADIGVSMGITGTDVAKEASDMIITDDNYATIVTAVGEGRTIFDNIKSAVKYLVGCNIGEVLAVVAGMLFGWPLILTPLQLLYVNLVTDGMPAIALALAPKQEGIMKRKPVQTTGMFRASDVLWFLEVSLLTAGVTLIAFFLGYQTGDLLFARALAFTAIILAQHVILLDIRTRTYSVLKKNVFRDSVFLWTFAGPLVLQLAILYIPMLAQMFKVASIPVASLVQVVFLSSSLLVSSEIRKAILSRKI